jgi:hypothetical protein
MAANNLKVRHKLEYKLESLNNIRGDSKTISKRTSLSYTIEGIGVQHVPTLHGADDVDNVLPMVCHCQK